MVILGIDPGVRFTGFGLVRFQAGQTGLMEYGCLKLPASKPLNARVSQFHDFFDMRIPGSGATGIAIETPFLGKNAQNFLKLGYLRGIIYHLSHKYDLPLYEFAPSEVKQAVTGYGGAGKDQVARVIMQLFPRMGKPETQDVTDAIAVTLCGAWRGGSAIARR